MARKTKNNPVTIPENMIPAQNYGLYNSLVTNGSITINTDDININNWNDHYNGILNIMKDGIETEYVQSLFVTVIFADGESVDLSVIDYFFNIIMWYLMVRVNNRIYSKHIFFDKELTKNSIKNYIDDFFITENRKRFSNKELNNIIYDTLYHYQVIDDFAMYLANTVNLEDDIKMMNTIPEYNKIFHADLSGRPIEEVKDVGMEMTNKVIEMIKNRSKDILGYDHCLANAFRSDEGVNPRQYKEFNVNIGSKPDGQGGVFPVIINKSFINGGVNDPLSYFIESSTGRTAQILAKMNVGSSGSFARLLGLNSMDSCLYPDPNYCCDSHNFMTIFIKNKTILKMLDNRYYRLNPHGVENLLRSKYDNHLIGQTIYLRSPVTCASGARGEGICYRCYGDLAYTTRDVNIGRIATEIISSILTQRLLSAKHLLETMIEKLNWVPKFYDIFEVEGNIVKLLPDLEYKNYRLIINPDSIELENEDDGSDDELDSDSEKYTNSYNEYITEFDIEYTPTREKFKITNDKSEKLYISIDLNTLIRKRSEAVEGKVSISLDDIKDISLFLIELQNNELSKTLDYLKSLLNKSTTIKNMTKDQLLQSILETIDTGKLNVTGVHMEVILSNQIRNVENILLNPKWEYDNEKYEIVTLNTALTCNPSVTISLSYQKIPALLYNPLTYKKNGASFMDLFFMKRPQAYLAGIVEEEEKIERDENGLIDPFEFFK